MRTPTGCCRSVSPDAERQARYRAKQRVPHPAPSLIAARLRRPAIPERHSRPQRWRDAVSELVELQAECAQWLAILPDSLHGSYMAEAPEAITDLDLTVLADVELPKGYGRD